MNNFNNEKYTSTNTEVPVFQTSMTKNELIDLLASAVKEVLEKGKMVNTLNPEELLTREESANEFKVSVATIDNYRRDGLIVPCRIGGIVRFKRGDLQKAFSGNILNPYKAATNGKRA